MRNQLVLPSSSSNGIFVKYFNENPREALPYRLPRLADQQAAFHARHTVRHSGSFTVIGTAAHGVPQASTVAADAAPADGDQRRPTLDDADADEQVRLFVEALFRHLLSATTAPEL